MQILSDQVSYVFLSLESLPAWMWMYRQKTQQLGHYLDNDSFFSTSQRQHIYMHESCKQLEAKKLIAEYDRWRDQRF